MKIDYDTTTNKFFTVVGGVRVESPNKQYLKTKVEKLIGKTRGYGSLEPETIMVNSSPQQEEEQFSVAERFSFVKRIVDMVAKGIQPSMVITGEGGLGKSHTVLTTLQSSGLTDVSLIESGVDVSDIPTYRVVKGFSTAKGLFRTLYENREGVVVYDDCDSVLKDPVAVNLLKGALDSYSERIISWNADLRDDDLPRSFKFDGRVIFISNLASYKLDQAIRSRSMCVDLSMNREQKIERMYDLIDDGDFLPSISLPAKQDALELISEFKDHAKELSLRTLISVCKIRDTNIDDSWKSLAKYMLVG